MLDSNRLNNNDHSWSMLVSLTPNGNWFTNPQWLHWGYLAGFLTCVGLMAAAFYFEYVLYLDPCPLCMTQRLGTVMIGVGFFLAFLSRNTRWLLLVALLFTLAAAVFSTWVADHQIWMQGLPKEEVPACGPSMNYLIETLPLTDLLSVMLNGDGNCAEIVWSLWGMSMPEWTRICFIGFVLAAVYAIFHTIKQRFMVRN